MKKYNPVQYNRTLWYDESRTKNHPKNCKEHHRFCSLQYQWSDNTLMLDNIHRPINATIPNIILPTSQQKGEVNYENMTEQSLDDWIAQSMNRNLKSMLNPNKKFFIPTTLDDDLRNRYRKLRKKALEADDSYFETKKVGKKQKSYLDHKKSKTIDITELVYDYKRLQPRPLMGKTPIQKRELKDNPHKSQPKRRNAVMLDRDIYFQRFMKEQQKGGFKQVSYVKEESKTIEQLNKNKLFTLNYESLRRRNSNDPAPTSITEYEGIQLALPEGVFSLNKNIRKQLQKQQDQQEMYRLKGNATAQKAYNMMENFSARNRRNYKATKLTEQQEKQKQKEPSLRQSVEGTAATILQYEKKLPPHIKLNLGRKVIKLLEEMRVQSETINPYMALFGLHPYFVSLTIFQHDNMAHNWIKKAQEQLSYNRQQTAFQCYKQAIIIQPQLFNGVYNFATLLERQNRLCCSLEWFKLAKEFQCDNDRVSFAVSLINLKMEKYEQSFNEINGLILHLTGHKRKVNVEYFYIRALCHKKMGKYDQAKKDYKLVLDESKPQNTQDLSKFVLSLFCSKKRRFIPYLSCISYIKLHQIVVFNLYQKGPRLNEDGEMEMANRIKNFPFFKRFPFSLVQKAIKISAYEFHQKEDILFVKPDECIIVLDGLVLIKNHQKSVKLHDIITLLQRGDFLGANRLDNNRNSNLNNWYYCHTDVELLRLKSLQFESLWKGQITFEVDFKYHELKNNRLFRNLSEATLFKLCQKIKTKTYQQNTVLFNDCSYRNKLISKIGEGFSLLQPNLVQAQIPTKNVFSSFTNKPLNHEQFNEIKFEGLFILKRGKVQIQDDRGFCNSDIIGEGDFFGENLIIECDGFHNYGRLIVANEEAEFYVMQLNDLVWCFSEDDKETMKKNCEDMNERKSLQTIKQLRRRYHEFLQIHQQINNVRGK